MLSDDKALWCPHNAAVNRRVGKDARRRCWPLAAPVATHVRPLKLECTFQHVGRTCTGMCSKAQSAPDGPSETNTRQRFIGACLEAGWEGCHPWPTLPTPMTLAYSLLLMALAHATWQA
eukprot:366122-Chlamydomonas_euryale.AAC.22